LKEMNMKRVVTVLTVLLLTDSIINLMPGKALPRAAAAEDNKMFIPPEGNASDPAPAQHPGVVQPQFESKKTAPAQRRPMSSRLAKAENKPPARDTATAQIVRKVLPWAAGALSLVGLGMIVCYLLVRRRLPDTQVARSIMQIRIPNAGWGKQRTTRAKLASRLAHIEPPPSQASLGDQQQEAEHDQRRAA
jgi:hypothetical protein